MSQMATRRLLLSVVIILLAVEYSSAKCYQGYIGRERKGLSDPKFLWGRKLLQGLRGKSVDIQGKSKPADLDINPFPVPQSKSDGIHAQSKGDMFDEQQHSQKSMAQATPTSYGNENAVDKHDDYITKNNDGSKAFLEAADEVANLMRKDYKGADRPRRKPPINNHEPKN